MGGPPLMPETAFPSYASFPEAKVSHAGAGWETKPGVNDRADTSLNLPLNDPRFQPAADDPAAQAAQAPRPVPTEAELRQRLADALAAREQSATAKLEAEEAHTRAQDHEQRGREALASFDGLAGEIDDLVINAVRAGESSVLPERLRSRLSERGGAEVELAAARRAVEVLRAELAQAEHAEAEARGSVVLGTLALTDIGRAKLRAEAEAMQKRLDALKQAASESDRSPLWAPVVAALHKDPLTAPVEVEVGGSPVPVPPVEGSVFQGPAVISIMTPSGPEHISRDEFFAREAAAKAAAERAATPFFIRAQRAVEQSHAAGLNREASSHG
jgi:hypothetical protein